MSKEKTTPPEVTVHTDGRNAGLPTVSAIADPAPPAVLLFGRYFKLLKGDPEKVWTFSNLELVRCQPGGIIL